MTGDPNAWEGALATFEVDLLCNGVVRQRGGGTYVLGSPLLVIQHLVRVLAGQPDQPALAAGEVVTTGTLTDAYPVSAGQTWSTRLSGIDLDGATITFG